MLLTRLRTAIVVLCVGLGGGYSAWEAVAAGGDGKDHEQEGGKAPTVRLIHPPVRTIVRVIGQPSFVEAYERTPIYSRRTGYIEKVAVDIGDLVKKGDVLAILRVPDIVDEPPRKNGAVTLQEERLKLSRNIVEVAEAELKAARARVTEAKAILDKYQAEVDRWDTEVKRLDREVKRGVVDAEVLLESRSQRKSSVAARDAARATIAKTEAELLAKEALLAKAKLDLSVAEAALAEATKLANWPEPATRHPVPRASMTGRADGAGVRTARDRVTRAKDILDSYQGDIERWDAELKRLKQVVGPQVHAKSAGPSPATAAQDAARAAIEHAETELLFYRAVVAKARVEAAIANAAATVADYQQNPGDPEAGTFRLIAPHDGVVVARSANNLAFVEPPTSRRVVLDRAPATRPRSTAPLFVIDRVDVLRVFIEVPEHDAKYVHVGTMAIVQLDARREEPIQATVARTSWAANVKSRTLRVEIDLPNQDGALKPGMYAYGKVIIDRAGVRALPLAAVNQSGDQSYCWILEDGKAVRTRVETGVSDGQWIEVERRALASRAGDANHVNWTTLDGSEQVIIGDLSTLHDGGPVQVDPRSGPLK